MKRRALTFALVAVGALFLLPSNGSAAALSTSIGAEKIVFSNGGRIIQVNADGTGREVLTRKGAVSLPGKRDQVLDRDPRVSPDGRRVLFTRFSRQGYSERESRLLRGGRNMLLDLVTGKIREVLSPTGKARYSNLAWLPGTDRVVASRISGRVVVKSSVVSVGLDGSRERNILRFQVRRGGFYSGSSRFEVAHLAPSPDGKRMLMTRMNPWSGEKIALELVDLESGKRMVIAGGAHSGAWSPDGSRIAFVRESTMKVCEADLYCYPKGQIFVAAGDGSGIRRLTDGDRDEDGPGWSPDGSRIVFSGTIVHPRDRSTAEIFTVSPDGTCLAGITNGSPASLDPVYRPGRAVDPGPAACGLADRPALAEGQLNQRMNKGLGRRLWLGPRSGPRLLSLDFDLGFFSYADYGDCASYRSENCPPGVAISTWPLCANQGESAELVAGLLSQGVKRRGVWVTFTKAGSDSWPMVFSGPQVTYITESTSGRRATGTLTRSELLELVDELRPEGEKLTRKLPRLLLPRFDFGLARYMTRYVRRHSVREAIKRFNMRRSEVIDHLKFKQNAKRLGAGVADCPRSIAL